jgi:formamidopyrimidine-DNA glycosylase
MPELPDVEHYKRYTGSTALKKKIKEVSVYNKKILDGISAGKFTDGLKGERFDALRRRGKYLFLRAGKKRWLYLHFGMTGDIRYFSKDGKKPDHTRVLFTFTNGYQLAFINQRLLGKAGITDTVERVIEEKELGPDALEIGRKEFAEKIGKKKGSVKAALMDQKAMAGVGNIYADEILFQSRVDPGKKVPEIGDGKIRKIYGNMNRILKKAAEKKADPDKFPRSWLIPRREKGADCPRCGGSLRKKKISGRSSYFCPGCQK